MALYKKKIFGTLKYSTSKLMSACGGLKNSAALPGIRVGMTQLCKYADHDCNDVFITVDQVATLEKYCKSPILTQELAKNLGYTLRKVRNIKYNNICVDHDIINIIARASRIVSDMMYVATIKAEYMSYDSKSKLYDEIMAHANYLQDLLDNIQDVLISFIDHGNE